jgi:hypothetical protein
MIYFDVEGNFSEELGCGDVLEVVVDYGAVLVGIYYDLQEQVEDYGSVLVGIYDG